MDKISVCGTGAPGSTPGESTYRKDQLRLVFLYVPEPGVGFL